MRAHGIDSDDGGEDEGLRAMNDEWIEGTVGALDNHLAAFNEIQHMHRAARVVMNGCAIRAMSRWFRKAASDEQVRISINATGFASDTAAIPYVGDPQCHGSSADN